VKKDFHSVKSYENANPAIFIEIRAAILNIGAPVLSLAIVGDRV
jgi:hypothetical protein